MVRADVRGADSGAGARLAEDRLWTAHPDPGADGLREDARRFPVRARPAAPGAGRRDASRLRLAAEGPELRHRAQPAWAAGRPPGGREGRSPHRRHAAEGAGGDAEASPRPADHDAGVALPDADLACAGDAGGRPDADPG